MKKAMINEDDRSKLMEIKELGIRAETNLQKCSFQMRDAKERAISYLSEKGVIDKDSYNYR